MTKNYYLKTLKNNTSIETIDIIQATVNDFESVCQANILKYVMRAIDKHDSPQADIKKIIDYCNFWLNHLNSEMATTDRNTPAPLKKMENLLNMQEKVLLKKNEINRLISKLNDNQTEILEYLLNTRLFNSDDNLYYLIYNFLEDYFRYDLPKDIEYALQNITDKEKNYLLLILIKSDILGINEEVLEMVKGK